MDYIIVNFLNGFIGKYFALDVLVILFSDFFILFLPFLVILVYLLKKKDFKPVVFKIFTGIFLAGFLNYIIAETIQRIRPFALYEKITQFSRFFSISPSDFSFPSDHTAIAFVIAFLVYYEWKNFGKVLILIASLIGLSRVFIGVHFLTDILAGIGVAFLVSFVVNKILIFQTKEE